MRLKRYEEFKDDQKINEEGKVANIATAAIMGISSLFGVAQTDELPKNVKQVLTQTTTDPAQAHRLEITGWKLTDTKIDTLWGTFPPDTIINKIEITLGGESFFESGDYELSQDQIGDVQSVLDTIIKERGILVSVKISSSTDKSPVRDNLADKLEQDGFTGDNEGLSKARAKGLTSYLNEQGVDSSLFEPMDIQVEKGDNNDPSSRFVRVTCLYLCCPQPPITTGGPQTTQTTYTYQKNVYKHDGQGDSGKRKYKKKKIGILKDFKSRKDLEKCYFDQTW